MRRRRRTVGRSSAHHRRCRRRSRCCRRWRGCCRCWCWHWLFLLCFVVQQISHHLLCDRNRQNLHDLAIDQPIDFHAKRNLRDWVFCRNDLRDLIFRTEIDHIDLRRRDINLFVEHRRQRCGDRSHHLIHRFADGAHMNLIEFLRRIRAVAAHHKIGDDRGVLRLDGEHVVSVNANRIADLHDEVRHRVLVFDRGQRIHRHCRCRDRNLVS